MGKVHVFDHPLIQHKTALMRKTSTSVKEFRELAKEEDCLETSKARSYIFCMVRSTRALKLYQSHSQPNEDKKRS